MDWEALLPAHNCLKYSGKSKALSLTRDIWKFQFMMNVLGTGEEEEIEVKARSKLSNCTCIWSRKSSRVLRDSTIRVQIDFHEFHYKGDENENWDHTAVLCPSYGGIFFISAADFNRKNSLDPLEILTDFGLKIAPKFNELSLQIDTWTWSSNLSTSMIKLFTEQ